MPVIDSVFERFRKLRIATIETNVGWIPAMMNHMDHGWRAQHMWQRPELPRPPSEYFREHCYTTLLEDAIRRAPSQYWWVHRRWRDQPRKARIKRPAA